MDIKAVLAGNRLILEVQTKEELYALRKFIESRPEIEDIPWIELFSSVDTSCDIVPIKGDKR